VIFVADEDLQELPASTVAPALALAAALDEPVGALEPVVLPPQAASVTTARFRLPRRPPVRCAVPAH
jgi:hypothetical protein